MGRFYAEGGQLLWKMQTFSTRSSSEQQRYVCSCLACLFHMVHVIVVSTCAHSSCVCVRVAAPAEECLLPMEEGSCGRYTLRWYFNSLSQACRPFIYSGCEGNANRFLHLEECEALCLGEVKGTHTHTHTHTHYFMPSIE